MEIRGGARREAPRIEYFGQTRVFLFHSVTLVEFVFLVIWTDKASFEKKEFKLKLCFILFRIFAFFSQFLVITIC